MADAAARLQRDRGRPGGFRVRLPRHLVALAAGRAGRCWWPLLIQPATAKTAADGGRTAEPRPEVKKSAETLRQRLADRRQQAEKQGLKRAPRTCSRSWRGRTKELRGRPRRDTGPGQAQRSWPGSCNNGAGARRARAGSSSSSSSSRTSAAGAGRQVRPGTDQGRFQDGAGGAREAQEGPGAGQLGRGQTGRTGQATRQTSGEAPASYDERRGPPRPTCRAGRPASGRGPGRRGRQAGAADRQAA